MSDGFVVADDITLASANGSHSLQTTPPLTTLRVADAHNSGLCTGSFVRCLSIAMQLGCQSHSGPLFCFISFYIVILFSSLFGERFCAQSGIVLTIRRQQ